MYKMFKSLLVAFFSILGLNAQIVIQDWDALRSKELKRHNISILLDGQVERQRLKFNLPTIINPPPSNISTNSLFKLNPSFQLRSSSAKKQQLVEIGITYSPSQLNYKSIPSSVLNSKQNQFHLEGQLINRVYINNNFYFQSGFTGQYTNLNAQFGASNIGRFYNSILQVKVPLAIGYGRIDEIQDAVAVQFIIHDLTAQNKLSRKLTDADVAEFTQWFSSLLNKRLINHNKLKSNENLELQAWLKSKQLISEDQALEIKDLKPWSYSWLPIRKTGYRFSFGLMPTIGHTRNFTNFATTSGGSSVNRSSSFYGQLSPSISLESSKPLSLKWQQDVSLSLRYDLFHSFNRFEEDNAQWIPSIQYQILYQPSLRSIVSAHTKFEYSLWKFQTSDLKSLATTIGIQYIYQVKPSILLQAGAQYANQNFKTNIKGILSPGVLQNFEYNQSNANLKMGILYRFY